LTDDSDRYIISTLVEMITHSHPSRHPKKSDPATLERTAALFRALADASRLHLLEALADGERCVTELAEDDGMSTVSQRLRVLYGERLVQKRRDGKHIYYSLADDHVADLVRAGIAHALEKNHEELSVTPPVRKKKRSPR
jgi:ArsR family transcriptional regulator, lead/cadmium/zinc/bismuth-responsive transcriptional repressor